jgi:hypothetical protein
LQCAKARLRLMIAGRKPAQECNPAYAVWLSDNSTRSKRPRDGCAAEHGDKLSPFQSRQSQLVWRFFQFYRSHPMPWPG